MNKLEASYASQLDLRKAAGEILWYAFETIKLRLANNTFLTVDFFVMTTDLELQAHEVKGFWEEDARVKIKVAADKYPFRFIGVRKIKSEWVFEEF